jgi:hypothetical protein
MEEYQKVKAIYIIGIFLFYFPELKNPILYM